VRTEVSSDFQWPWQSGGALGRRGRQASAFISAVRVWCIIQYDCMMQLLICLPLVCCLSLCSAVISGPSFLMRGFQLWEEVESFEGVTG